MAQKRMPGVSERSFITSLEDFSLAKGRVGLYSTAQKEVTTVSLAVTRLLFIAFQAKLVVIE